MTDVRDPASMIEAAQKAVGDGDYLEAERLLREAAAIQEAALGGSHSDLATTLNNLAFVCERTGNFDEAERGYRRAHAIAVASLSPGHPFIKTSLSNLVEFCEARGIPIWTPPETTSEDEPLPDETGDEAPPVPAMPDPVHQPAVISRLPLRLIGSAALVVAVIVVIVFARREDTPEAPRSVRLADTGSAAPPAPELSTATTPPPVPTPPPAPAPEPAVEPVRRLDKPGAPVAVLNAQVCVRLERRGSPDWQCEPASGDVRPGTYRFYTRLLTTAATTVEHRWYRNGRVHQTMRLRISASPGSGYRTFSATTISPERAGDWKVELRAADGSVLHEERFVVR